VSLQVFSDCTDVLLQSLHSGERALMTVLNSATPAAPSGADVSEVMMPRAGYNM